MIGSRPWIMALVLTALIASSASAQQAAKKAGAGPQGVFFTKGQPIGLLSNPQVQKELNLGVEQVKKAATAAESAMSRQREAAQVASKLEEATPGAFKESMDVAMFAIADDYKQELATFLRPEQLKKLREITIKRFGWAVFQDLDLRKDLKVTKEQNAKMDEILAEKQKQQGEISRRLRVPETRQEATKLSLELNKKTLSDLVSVLNEDQKQLWQEMQPPPEIPVPKPRP
jgi:hypothetical protein